MSYAIAFCDTEVIADGENHREKIFMGTKYIFKNIVISECY